MTRRATLRGAERVPLEGDAARADVLICGASFAGLAVARELAGSGADVLVVDRYVELELAGRPADQEIPGMRAHLEGCPASDEDHASLLAFVQREG